MARPTGREIRTEIVDVATVLIQRQGVSGFSYSDVASQLLVKAPSIHHHFRTKDDLVAEVVSTYTERFASLVADIPAGTAVSRILAYADLFAQVAANDRLCLCGSVSADWPAVGASSQREVEQFFASQRRWLTSEIESGTEQGELRTDIDSDHLAVVVLSALEGSLLLDMASSNGVSDLLGQTLVALLARNEGPGMRVDRA